MDYGLHLKIARQEAGASQAYMAEKLGVPRGTYCGWEMGKIPTASGKVKINAYLKSHKENLPLPKQRSSENEGDLALAIGANMYQSYLRLSRPAKVVFDKLYMGAK